MPDENSAPEPETAAAAVPEPEASTAAAAPPAPASSAQALVTCPVCAYRFLPGAGRL